MNLNVLLRDAIDSDTFEDKQRFFASCYEGLFEKVYAISKYIAPLDAEDITSGIFNKIFEMDLPSLLKHSEYLEKYLLALAKNYCLTHKRINHKKNNPKSLDEIDPLLYSVSPTSKIDTILDINEALDSIKPKQKEVILLMLEGYRYNEIAEILNVSEGAVKNHVYRGKDSIKRFYQEKEKIPEISEHKYTTSP